MKRRYLIHLIGCAALVLVLGSSVEFRRLEDKRAEERAEGFQPTEYARDFWDNRLDAALDAAVAAEELIGLFNTNMEAAVRKGRTLGHSRVRAYLLQGAGRITATDRDGLQVSVLADDPGAEVLICTGAYISGNAVRDASGLIDVSAFSDTMRFNRISSEINRIVVQDVIAPFLARRPQVGMVVRFVGAAEVADDATERVPFGGRLKDNQVESDRHLLKVVPIRLELEPSLVGER